MNKIHAPLQVNNNQNSYSKQKSNDILKEAKAISSQFSGKVSNIRYIYSNNSIKKAVITIRADKETAKKIASNSSNVQIRVIIDESLNKSEKNKESKKLDTVDNKESDKLEKNSEKPLKDIFYDEKKYTSKNTYSYYRGSDGKTYALIGNESSNTKKDNTIYTSKNKLHSDEYYKNLFKRYNFKNIKFKNEPEKALDLLV